MTPPIPGPDEGLNSAVAAELRAEQGRQKLSVAALAEAADIPYGTLRRYLNAERHIDLAVLGEICKALNVEISAIVETAAARVRFADRSNAGDQILVPPKKARVVDVTPEPALADEGVDFVLLDGTRIQVKGPSSIQLNSPASPNPVLLEGIVAERIIQLWRHGAVRSPEPSVVPDTVEELLELVDAEAAAEGDGTATILGEKGAGKSAWEKRTEHRERVRREASSFEDADVAARSEDTEKDSMK